MFTMESMDIVTCTLLFSLFRNWVFAGKHWVWLLGCFLFVPRSSSPDGAEKKRKHAGRRNIGALDYKRKGE